MSAALRAPSPADVPAAARLVGRHWPEPVDDARIEHDWSAPGVDLARDARIGADAYVLVEDIGNGRAWIEAHGADVAAAVDWAERRAAELGASRILSGAWSTNEPVLHALEQRGYAFARRSQRMLIDLDQPTEAPVWPAGVAVRSFTAGDERLFYDVQAEAFRDTWEPMEESLEEWSHWHLEPPRFSPAFWFVAHAGSASCGVIICHPHPTVPDLGWIGVLAVRSEWRRRGIGRALLLHAFGRLREAGLRRAGLGVDSDSVTGAHTLYESVGMRAAEHFEIYERPLA